MDIDESNRLIADWLDDERKWNAQCSVRKESDIGWVLVSTSRCGGNSAPMRISGLLNDAAVRASFGPPLESLQRILYASLDRLAEEFLEYPPPPT
jgi:hypothetical protein